MKSSVNDMLQDDLMTSQLAPAPYLSLRIGLVIGLVIGPPQPLPSVRPRPTLFGTQPRYRYDHWSRDHPITNHVTALPRHNEAGRRDGRRAKHARFLSMSYPGCPKADPHLSTTYLCTQPWPLRPFRLLLRLICYYSLCS